MYTNISRRKAKSTHLSQYPFCFFVLNILQNIGKNRTNDNDMHCFIVDHNHKSNKQGYIKPINNYKSIKTIDLFMCA